MVRAQYKKIYLLIVLAVFCFACPAFGADTVTKSDLKSIMDRLDGLEKENAELKEMNSSVIGKNDELSQRINDLESRMKSAGTADVADLTEEVEELSELMEVVERRSMLDKIQISGELRTRADWFDFTEKVPVYDRRGRKSYSSHHNEEIHALMSNRFRLNLKADINKDMQFYGRLTMFKNWQKYKYKDSSYADSGRGRADAELRVERAYINYFFELHEKLPMALTFGRLPMADSLPTDLRENTPRKGTYPALAYDITADGVGLSLMLDKLTNLKSSAFRLVYLRRTEAEEGRLFYRQREENFEDQDYWIAQFETMLPGRYLKDILFVANLSYIPDFPSLDLTSSSVMKVKDLPNSLGSVWTLTLFMEAKRFLDSNFDWFAGYAMNNTDASERPARYAVFGAIPVNIGLGGPDNSRDQTGKAVHVGVRYNIPIKRLNNPKFGVEYNWGSKHWYTSGTASEDPLRKLMLNGHCWDFYYIQPLNKNLSIRLGYTKLKREYPKSDASQYPSRFEEKVVNTYMLLDAKF